jgi:hypothetical protein
MTKSGKKVGYGSPPEHSKFKKGQSGNPWGRPKGRKNFWSELLEELQKEVEVREGGRTRRVPMQTVVVKRLVADAAKGDHRARDQLLRMLISSDLDPAPVEDNDATRKADVEILARYRKRILLEIKND